MNPMDSKYYSINCVHSARMTSRKRILTTLTNVFIVSYRVDTEAVCACDAERVVFICKNNDVWNWVDT